MSDEPEKLKCDSWSHLIDWSGALHMEAWVYFFITFTPLVFNSHGLKIHFEIYTTYIVWNAHTHQCIAFMWGITLNLEDSNLSHNEHFVWPIFRCTLLWCVCKSWLVEKAFPHSLHLMSLMFVCFDFMWFCRALPWKNLCEHFSHLKFLILRCAFFTWLFTSFIEKLE